MTKELKTIDLNILPIDTLKEMANEAGEQVEKNAILTVQKAADCGRYLIAIKEQCEPGKWLEWLGVNWNYSQPTASRYITIAEGYSRVNNVRDAKSIREALRMIAAEKVESEPATAPRSARKTADVVVTTPSEQPGQTDVQADPDPAPAPPTNRKTAKGSEKVPEADKPRTQQIPVEIMDDEPESDPIQDWIASHTLTDLVTMVLGTVDDEKTKKAAAKQLRKLADKLDPPTKFVKPDLEDVAEYFRELQAVDPESFFDFYESKGWLVGKVSMKDWRASARKWVRENHANGKVNGNGHSGTRNGRSRGLTADEVFSAESMGRSR